MPFIKLVETHRCPLPLVRDDGSQLFIGDMWECDICHKQYQQQFNQREGTFWMPITLR